MVNSGRTHMTSPAPLCSDGRGETQLGKHSKRNLLAVGRARLMTCFTPRSAASPLPRTLFRAVLRTGARFDADPITRSLLGSPLLRASESASTAPLPHNTSDKVAEQALVGAIDEMRSAAPNARMVSLAAEMSPIKLRNALSHQCSALHEHASSSDTGAPTHSELGDAGFSLLRYLGATHALSERLFTPPAGSEAALHRCGDEEEMARQSCRPVRAGDCLAADPLAYNERFLDALYAVTPMALLVLRGAEQERCPGLGLVLNGAPSCGSNPQATPRPPSSSYAYRPASSRPPVGAAPSILRLRAHDWMRAAEMPLGGLFSRNRAAARRKRPSAPPEDRAPSASRDHLTARNARTFNHQASSMAAQTSCTPSPCSTPTPRCPARAASPRPCTRAATWAMRRSS